MISEHRFLYCIMEKVKKRWLIALIIISILALTNPTDKDLENYLESSELRGSGGRVNYFMIFSVFKVHVNGFYKNPNRIYIGIFKNFICVNKKEE